MVWLLAGLAFLLALAFFRGMRRQAWPRPSTRAFARKARRTLGYGLFDWLHGYVYARWPYLYISIGTGEHHPGRSRWSTPDEAVNILRAEHDRGRVHHAFFKDAMLGRFYAICNCCACCCGAMQAH